MLKDVAKRPFITAGFTAFLLMVPLALTSTKGWIRRMGGKRWQLLHRLIYISGIAGVVHYYWLVKSDVRLPVMYGAFVGALLLYRAAVWAMKHKSRTSVKHPIPISTAHCAIIRSWKTHACFLSWYRRTTKRNLSPPRFCVPWTHRCRRAWNPNWWRLTTLPPIPRRRFSTNSPSAIPAGFVCFITK